MGNAIRRVLEDCNVGELPVYMQDYVDKMEHLSLNSLPKAFFTPSATTAETYVTYSGTDPRKTEVRMNLPQRQTQEYRRNPEAASNETKESFFKQPEDSTSERKALANLVDAISSSV